MTAGHSVTLSGLSMFGDSHLISSSAHIRLTSCQTAAWSSTTSVACHFAAGDGVSHLVTAVVMGVVGTCRATFSYDGARAPWEQRLAILWYLADLSFTFLLDSYDYKASHFWKLYLPDTSTCCELRCSAERSCHCGTQCHGQWAELRHQRHHSDGQYRRIRLLDDDVGIDDVINVHAAWRRGCQTRDPRDGCRYSGQPHIDFQLRRFGDFRTHAFSEDI